MTANTLQDSSQAPYLLKNGRDLRFDFIRGAVMWVLLINHIEIFSFWNHLVWERIGVISGGEGFVIVSGMVVGMINRKKMDAGKQEMVFNNCLARSVQLYRVNVFIIVSVLILHLLPWPDASAAMTFHDRGSDKIYPLYPGEGTPIMTYIGQILLLRCGPHQFQIIGLYILLIAATPWLLARFKNHHTKLILGISWLIYFYQALSPSRPTKAQFEYGFPILAWQLIYIHGLAFGFHIQAIKRWFSVGRRTQILLVLSTVLFLVFLFFTLNNPSPNLPDFLYLNLIEKDVFYNLYHQYFRKNQLGILRILNYAVILILAFKLLSVGWRWIFKACGWFFVPIGQATLYAFIIHVYLIILLDQFGYLQGGTFWQNTIVHSVALLTVWLMVRFKIGFKWIPR